MLSLNPHALLFGNWPGSIGEDAEYAATSAPNQLFNAPVEVAMVESHITQP